MNAEARLSSCSDTTSGASTSDESFEDSISKDTLREIMLYRSGERRCRRACAIVTFTCDRLCYCDYTILFAVMQRLYSR